MSEAVLGTTSIHVELYWHIPIDVHVCVRAWCIYAFRVHPCICLKYRLIRMFTILSTQAHIYMHNYIGIHIYIHIYTSAHAHAYAYTYSIYVCMYVCMLVCMCVFCLFVYVSVHILSSLLMNLLH